MTDCYSSKLDEALRFAADAFRDRIRKGTESDGQRGVPYLAHLLQVTVWVAEHGGNEDQLIAAVLHDYLEDIPGASAATLCEQFGPEAARLVEGLSDATDAEHKPAWQQRKVTYLRRLAAEPDELKLISACDKLHNARSIARDLDRVGEAVWDRFKGKRDGTLWYYRAVLTALGQGWSHALLAELTGVVEQLHRRAGVAFNPEPLP